MTTYESRKIKDDVPFWVETPHHGIKEIKTLDDVSRKYFYYYHLGTRYKIHNKTKYYMSLQDLNNKKLDDFTKYYKQHKDTIYKKYQEFKKFEEEHPELCI